MSKVGFFSGEQLIQGLVNIFKANKDAPGAAIDYAWLSDPLQSDMMMIDFIIAARNAGIKKYNISNDSGKLSFSIPKNYKE